jgi:hypothetical protein
VHAGGESGRVVDIAPHDLQAGMLDREGDRAPGEGDDVVVLVERRLRTGAPRVWTQRRPAGPPQVETDTKETAMTDPSEDQPHDTVRPTTPALTDPSDEDVELDENDRPEGSTALRTAETPVEEPPPQTMIPARARRRTKLERGSMRVLATGGIIGLATVLGAILVSQDVDGWIVGLAVGLTSVILAALLWSSRQL